MKTVTLDIPVSLSPNTLNHFVSLNKSLEIIPNESHILYVLDDENKKGDLLATYLELPLVNLAKKDREISVFRSNYRFKFDTQFRYIADHDKQYLILFYLSSNTDFKEHKKGKIIQHKKGDWIVASLSNGEKPYTFQFPKSAHLHALSLFIPTDSLESFINTSPSYSYLQRLIQSEESYLIYESVSSSLKQIFGAISTNSMKTFLEMLNFQEHIYSFLKTIFEQLSQNNINAIKHNFKKGDINALIKAEKLLLNNIKQPPTIQELASEAAMSPTKFKSVFKKVYGESVYQYYLKHRMELAQQWIVENKLNISEIARELGYKNLAHFSRVFKEYYGKLPSKYL